MASIGETAGASAAAEKETTLRVFERTARAHANQPALREKRDGAWRTITWADYYQQVRRVARGLICLGVEPGAGVAIMGFNCARWLITDLAAIAAGGVPTGIYNTCTSEQCRYVADHCEAAVIVLEDETYLERFDRSVLPHLRAIVLMRGASDADDVHSWQELQDFGAEVEEEKLDDRIAAQRPDDLCTLIYTSGTTGEPKGVMLSHRNIQFVSECLVDLFGFEAGDSLLCYLPLSHIAEQVISVHAPLRVGACAWFAESLEALAENLREVRPHIFFGVPRVWEKIQAKMAAAGAQSPPLRRKLVAWARRQGLAGGYADQGRAKKPLLYGLARRLVFSKVRQRLGLDRARVCSTSAAPISLDTLEFFLSLGIPILEVYGMSECTGPATLSYPDRYRSGKAGFAIPGGELAIAEDGEILIRGPHVFLGYYKNSEATHEAVDQEGWIHSGDIGELDGDGFLAVTDRKKELLVTSGGKNVAPQPLEAALKTIPVVGQAVVVGDRRNYIAALLTLDPDRLAEVTVTVGSAASNEAEAARCPRISELLEEQVATLNKGLARYEGIRRFRVLPRQLSIEAGELTPTLKLKRRVVYERYADEIEALYA